MEIGLAELVGTAAGLGSASSFVPQAIKAWRDGDAGAISKHMYIITISAFCLWITYGVMIGSFPVIVFNIASLCLATFILLLKLRHERVFDARGDRSRCTDACAPVDGRSDVTERGGRGAGRG